MLFRAFACTYNINAVNADAFEISKMHVSIMLYNHCQYYLQHPKRCAVLFLFSFVFPNTTTSVSLSPKNSAVIIEKRSYKPQGKACSIAPSFFYSKSALFLGGEGVAEFAFENLN